MRHAPCSFSQKQRGGDHRWLNSAYFSCSFGWRLRQPAVPPEARIARAVRNTAPSATPRWTYSRREVRRLHRLTAIGVDRHPFWKGRNDARVKDQPGASCDEGTTRDTFFSLVTLDWLLLAVALLMIGALLYSWSAAVHNEHPSLFGRALGLRSAERRALLGAMLAQLDLVENELRRLGWWLDQPEPPSKPDATKLYAGLPFHHWLQYDFLPEARSRLCANNPPTSSAVGIMAMRQYDYHSPLQEALPLVRLLRDLDELVDRSARDAEVEGYF